MIVLFYKFICIFILNRFKYRVEVITMAYQKQYYKRGYYVKKIIDDYCVIDIETTGLTWQKDKIIEIGILKV